MTMRESDTYRRGLTLGLTMAEIFILILFLRLLVLLALYAVNFEQEKELQSATEYITEQQNLLPEDIVPLTKENQSLKKENQILKDALDAADTESGKLQNTIDNLSTQLANATEENQSLKNDLDDADTESGKLQNTIDNLSTQLANATEENQSLKNDLDDADTESGKLQNTIDNFSTQLANATEENQILKNENQSLTEENQSLADALDEANTLPKEPRERQAETENKNKSQQKIISNLRGQLAAAKGIDPPCWYKVTTRDGERHESPYYLMDVAVYNAHLQVRMRAAPPGYALDESKQKATTSYQEEYDKLPLPPSGTTKQVSLRQFATMTEPIKRMGKNKQIRDYACVFYAKVWDFTPATETVQKTQRSSFLTPLAPLIRGELSGKPP